MISNQQQLSAGAGEAQVCAPPHRALAGCPRGHGTGSGRVLSPSKRLDRKITELLIHSEDLRPGRTRSETERLPNMAEPRRHDVYLLTTPAAGANERSASCPSERLLTGHEACSDACGYRASGNGSVVLVTIPAEEQAGLKT